jgi:hypothetical protein
MQEKEARQACHRMLSTVGQSGILSLRHSLPAPKTGLVDHLREHLTGTDPVHLPHGMEAVRGMEAGLEAMRAKGKKNPKKRKTSSRKHSKSYSGCRRLRLSPSP